MRVLITASMPVETGNATIRDGSLPVKIQKILSELKPEAAYFGTNEKGDRTAIIVVNMTDTSQMPAMAEPFFLGFNAQVTFRPVMNAEDLMNSRAGMEASVKSY